MGDLEFGTPVLKESLLKYHPLQIWNLTYGIWGHCLVGSLTGVVASKSVTEAFKGTLRTVGNRLVRAISEGCLTVRRTCRAGRKLGYSDPVVLYGRAIAQRIKGTPGTSMSARHILGLEKVPRVGLFAH